MDERYIIAPAALKAELFGAELNAVSAHGLLEHVLEPMIHCRTCEGILEEYAKETGGDLDKAPGNGWRRTLTRWARHCSRLSSWFLLPQTRCKCSLWCRRRRKINMFISRTTRDERVTIETALDSAFLKIDQAEQLIYEKTNVREELKAAVLSLTDEQAAYVLRRLQCCLQEKKSND